MRKGGGRKRVERAERCERAGCRANGASGYRSRLPGRYTIAYTQLSNPLPMRVGVRVSERCSGERAGGREEGGRKEGSTCRGRCVSRTAVARKGGFEKVVFLTTRGT